MPAAIDAAWEKLHGMAAGAAALIPNIAIAAIAFVLFAVAARAVASGVSGLAARTGQAASVARVFARIARGMTLVFGGLIAATIVFPSLDAASIFGALGVGGVAVGFAFKDIFQNLLAGMLILITRPFKIGDQIVSGAHEGTVDDIQIRATLVRTYDNRRIVIPNSELFTNRVIVNTAFDRRRVQIMVGTGYGDDIDLAESVILREVGRIARILQKPAPSVLVRALNDSTVDLEIRFWIEPSVKREVVETTDAVIRAIKPALVAAGIDLPFPTQQVLFHDQTERTDGDRRRQREGWPSRDDDPSPREDDGKRADKDRGEAA